MIKSMVISNIFNIFAPLEGNINLKNKKKND